MVTSTATMHILLLDLGLDLRGGQRQVLYLAKFLHALHLDGEPLRVTVACPAASPLAREVTAADVPLLPLSGCCVANPLLLLTLERMVRREGVYILHTNDAKAATVGGWFKCWHPDLRLVHARRVSYPVRQGVRGRKYRAADALIGVSAEISAGLVAAGIPADKVYTVHSGIDPSTYTPKRNRGDGRFVFGAIGALTTQKGFSVLVQAMSVLAEMEDLMPWEVRIVGEGPLFDALLEEAHTLGVAERLALFGRQASRQMLPDFDALLVPSVDGEGSSATIKEGWATGIPVVCSSLPSNEELITDKRDGLVVPKGNALALGTAMLRLIKEPVLAARLVAAGHETLQAFTANRMAERTCAIYQALHVPSATSEITSGSVVAPSADAAAVSEPASSYPAALGHSGDVLQTPQSDTPPHSKNSVKSAKSGKSSKAAKSAAPASASVKDA